MKFTVLHITGGCYAIVKTKIMNGGIFVKFPFKVHGFIDVKKVRGGKYYTSYRWISDEASIEMTELTSQAIQDYSSKKE